MINLLPDNAKKELRAARTNVRLGNYLVMLGIGLVFLGGLCFAVYLALDGEKSSAEAIINSNRTKSTSFGSVEEQGNTLRTSLSTAKTILDQEVLYSKVLTGIAALTPSGVVIDGLNLAPTTFGTPLSLQVFAISNEAALSLKDKFQSSPLFSSVSFQSLTSSTVSGAYPVSATMSVVINKSAAR